MDTLPETTVVSHAPGWTLFKDVYMAGGTLFVVSSAPKSTFPEARYMISNPLEALNTPENIAAREPSDSNICWLSPETAKSWWGGNVKFGERNRVWSVEGGTLLNNDPPQFLDHYYHFIGEFIMGVQAFWTSAFTPEHTYLDPTALPPSKGQPSESISKIASPSSNHSIPPITRLIFPNVGPHEWRDRPGFNAYFLRAAFPSVDVEVAYDWNDRVDATTEPNDKAYTRAWHFPHLLLHDRSAAFRGDWCGSKSQRIAAEVIEKARAEGRLVKSWWARVRQSVAAFAGADSENDVMEPETERTRGTAMETRMPRKIVVTYISRQDARRHLLDADHAALVTALREYVKARNSEWTADRTGTKREWELVVAKGESMTKDEQVRLFGRTSILLGVHGNGLTHCVLMPPSAVSTVIEMFYPGGYAHDYEWTSKALGHRYFGTWNDTSFTDANLPTYVSYPEGFQGTEISITPSVITGIIDSRLMTSMPASHHARPPHV
ncbi:hypothetical protein FIBSPDRAFT_719926 [Athelia psychrophila]|uniref:Glycosyltransferase 61 catalytic domain-containing protein n=1 Tax=Athelia psychrophila TaxID=1759441 RepID=A0A166X0C3_9AGAM|nr:hypothetical protein FIBSPDRAFT_719926 [Fibularhizoctonia sp. CBS 109695]